MRKNGTRVEDLWNELKNDGMPNTKNTQQLACKSLDTTDHDFKKLTR